MTFPYTRSLVGVVLAAGAALVYGAAAPVPPQLAVPAGRQLTLTARASGVQIYECRATPDAPTDFRWAFKAPDATLFDDGGKPIGKHYAGPTWEGNDGGKVVGSVVAQAASPDAGAVAWLLLAAREHSGGGAIGTARDVQRLDTAGGKAPAGGCSAATAGALARVPYTAVYKFYR